VEAVTNASLAAGACLCSDTGPKSLWQSHLQQSMGAEPDYQYSLLEPIGELQYPDV
jgi:hypothetical protein